MNYKKLVYRLFAELESQGLSQSQAFDFIEQQFGDITIPYNNRLARKFLEICRKQKGFAYQSSFQSELIKSYFKDNGFNVVLETDTSIFFM